MPNANAAHTAIVTATTQARPLSTPPAGGRASATVSPCTLGPRPIVLTAMV